MDSGTIGITFGILGTALSSFLGYRTVRIQSQLTKAEQTAKIELSSVEQAFKAWREINEANAKKIDELDDDCKALRTELNEEGKKRHACEIALAKLDGKVDILTNVQSRQSEIQNTQDLRQTERSNAQDVRSNQRHDRQDIRQDDQDERIDEREKKQDEKDAKRDERDKLLRVGDEVKLVKGEGK